MHAGALQGIHLFPVHKGRRAFHQKEGRLFQAPHQRVAGCRPHGRPTVVRLPVPLRIGIPGNDIQLLRKFEIVEGLEKLHHVDGHRLIAVFAHRADLRSAEILHLIAHEALPVQIQAVKAVFPVRDRTVDLIPGGIGMAPEGGPPGMVQILQRFIFFPEPFPEGLLAELAVAFSAQPVSAVLVGNMPQDHSGMTAQPPGKLPVDLLHLSAHQRGCGAEIMPPAGKVPHAVRSHLAHLVVLLHEPLGHRAAGRGENGINAVFIKPVNDPSQPAEMILALCRFQLRPGKNAQGNAVYMGLLHQPDVFLQHPGAVQPLIRIVVSSVQKMGMIFDRSFHSFFFRLSCPLCSV